jgi:hypothetical protein
MNVEEFKGWTGLSPPAAYPSTIEREMQSPTPERIKMPQRGGELGFSKN